jgi:hypothetical protein
LDWTIAEVWMVGGVIAATAWSAYIDYWFFRLSLKRTIAGATRDLLVQRFVTWSMVLATIGGPTIWSDTTGRLW